MSAVLPWVAWVALFGVLEYRGLRHEAGAEPLTEVIKKHIPGWMVWMGIGWLMYHFSRGFAR